jgi:hypothetical protein
MNRIRLCIFEKYLWVVPRGPGLVVDFVKSCGLPPKVVLKRFPTIMVNIIHTCHVGFHIGFSSIERCYEFWSVSTPMKI